MEPLVLESAQIIPSLKLTFSPLKIGRNPIGKDRLPTIHFQGLLLLVSGRVIFHQPTTISHKNIRGPMGPFQTATFWGGANRSCFRSRANLTRWSGLLISTAWQGRSMLVFPKIMGKHPPNHPFVHRVFHEINHPFWGFSPYSWFNTHVGVLIITPPKKGALNSGGSTHKMSIDGISSIKKKQIIFILFQKIVVPKMDGL